MTSTEGAKWDLSKHKQTWMRKEEHPFVRITSSLEMLPGRKGSQRWPSATAKQGGWQATWSAVRVEEVRKRWNKP